MSNKYCALVVNLEKDLSEEDADIIRDAIRLLRGVLAVTLVRADPQEEHIMALRVRTELFDLVTGVLLGNEWDRQ